MGLFRKKKPADPTPQQPKAPAPPAAGTGASAASPQTPAAPQQPKASAQPAPAPAAAASAATTPAATAATGPQTVTLYDAFGRPQQMPRDQWRKDVLPKMIDAFAHAPDRLAQMILQGLHDGLAGDLLPAALRLCAVDPDPERGLATLAAVQRECGELAGSAASLRELQQKRPQSVAARVGQALLKDKAGDRAGGTALLWEAVGIDPNHPDALHGLLQWEHERMGKDGYGDLLTRVCDLPASWRAQLWRARWRLERGDAADAQTDYRSALATAGAESDALLMAATDLVRTGNNDLVAELVLPRYRVDAHHPGVGIQLLQYYLQTKQPQPGMLLLHQLRVRFQRLLDQQLARYDAEFTRMTLPPPAAPTAGTPKVVVYRIDKPLWYAELGDPAFLLAPKLDAPQVLVAALSTHAIAGPATTPETRLQREDELGRLTRSVPLFLQEQLWLHAQQRAGVALPIADVGGWVVSSAPWPEDRLAQLLSAEERARTRLVTGAIRADGEHRRVDLWVYDCATQQRTGHAAAEGEAGKLGGVLLQLLAELSPLVGGPAALKPPVGDDVYWDRFAAGVGQLAALVVARLGAMPKDRVYGHRAILEWLLSVCLQQRAHVPARLHLSAGIQADAAIGSPVHKELAGPFVELFRTEPAASPFAQTAVLPLRTLGLQQMWQHRRAEIVAAGSDAYRQWLQRVEEGSR